MAPPPRTAPRCSARGCGPRGGQGSCRGARARSRPPRPRSRSRRPGGAPGPPTRKGRALRRTVPAIRFPQGHQHGRRERGEPDQEPHGARGAGGRGARRAAGRRPARGCGRAPTRGSPSRRRRRSGWGGRGRRAARDTSRRASRRRSAARGARLRDEPWEPARPRAGGRVALREAYPCHEAVPAWARVQNAAPGRSTGPPPARSPRGRRDACRAPNARPTAASRTTIPAASAKGRRLAGTPPRVAASGPRSGAPPPGSRPGRPPS